MSDRQPQSRRSRRPTEPGEGNRHAFIDESNRDRDYLICAATLNQTDLDHTRRALQQLRTKGQRRLHFATESDQRRKQLLAQMAELNLTTIVLHARHHDQTAARRAILTTAVGMLQASGVNRLVLESRQGQDKHDRATIYQALSPQSTVFEYAHHPGSAEPMLWVPDAVAWAWGRGGQWRQRVDRLGLVAQVTEVQVHKKR